MTRARPAGDVVDEAREDLRFHDTIAAACGSPVLRIMLSSIGGMMFEMMLRSHSDPRIGDPGVPHHPAGVSWSYQVDHWCRPPPHPRQKVPA